MPEITSVPEHRIWFFWGQKEMSYLRFITLKTAVSMYSNVSLVIRRSPVKPTVAWSEKQDFQSSPPKINWMPEAMKLPLTLVDIEDLAPEIAAKGAPDIQTADLLKWWILANEGGTVADMDIVFINRSAPLIREDVELVIFSGHPKVDYVPVSFMQGRPCLFWKIMYKRALAAYRIDDYESCGSQILNYRDLQKPGLLNEEVIFPWAGYPWVRWQEWLFEHITWPGIPPLCCGIHWYAGHNQKWNGRINCIEDLPLGGAVAWAVRLALGGTQ